jgi:hypothetical protein
MARQYCARYHAAAKKQKPVIALELVRQVHSLSPPGRFLKHKMGGWEEATEDIAKEKVSQCLRDIVASQLKAGNSLSTLEEATIHVNCRTFMEAPPSNTFQQYTNHVTPSASPSATSHSQKQMFDWQQPMMQPYRNDSSGVRYISPPDVSAKRTMHCIQSRSSFEGMREFQHPYPHGVCSTMNVGVSRERHIQHQKRLSSNPMNSGWCQGPSKRVREGYQDIAPRQPRHPQQDYGQMEQFDVNLLSMEQHDAARHMPTPFVSSESSKTRGQEDNFTLNSAARLAYMERQNGVFSQQQNFQRHQSDLQQIKDVDIFSPEDIEGIAFESMDEFLPPPSVQSAPSQDDDNLRTYVLRMLQEL